MENTEQNINQNIDQKSNEAEVAVESAIDKINSYREGVINCLNTAEKPFPVLDFSMGRFGLTSLALQGKQYLIISHLNEGVEGFPKGSDISSNVIGLQFNNLREVRVFESWLEIIKANLVSKANMEEVVENSEGSTTTE